MASAAAAKRRSDLNSNGSKALKRSASGGAAAASAAASTTVAMNVASTSIQIAPKSASLSEKRRVAALISWEKRRRGGAGKKTVKAKKAAKAPKRKATAATEAVAVPVTPTKVKKMAMQTAATATETDAAQPEAKRPKFGAGPAERAKAARLAKVKDRENNPSAAAPPASAKAASSGSYGWEKRRNEKAATTVRSQAAKLGWERRRKEKVAAKAAAKAEAAGEPGAKEASEIRRQAAKLGWERRRNQKLLPPQPPASSDSSDASSGDEAPPAPMTVKQKKAAAAAAAKVYSADKKRRAAIAGWERRNANKVAAGTTTTADHPWTYDVLSMAKPPSQAAPPKPYRQGTKRSRRLASSESGGDFSHDLEARRINELVTHLRLARGWMEFHPSSRHGSGTATYGYIPSSIASFVRSGAISQKTVLDHGTLGVHFALDWDGYGGLRDMIATFGEDYSPYPTEEMMRDSRVTEWELGEDLPWREVAEAAKEEEERLRQQEEDMQDIFFVAGILSSLDPEKEEQAIKAAAPSLLALKDYQTSSNNGSESDSSICNTHENPLTHLAQVAADTTTEEEEEKCKRSPKFVEGEDNVLIIQDFKNWNFGLC